jgi:hypothetical protein
MKRVTVRIDRVVLRGVHVDQATFGHQMQGELARLLARHASADGFGAREIRTIAIRCERHEATRSPVYSLAHSIAGALRP